MITKDFIKAQEAADYLGVSLNYLYKLTSSHAIPFYSPRGRILLFKVDELRDYVENARVSSDMEMESKADALLSGI